MTSPLNESAARSGKTKPAPWLSIPSGWAIAATPMMVSSRPVIFLSDMLSFKKSTANTSTHAGIVYVRKYAFEIEVYESERKKKTGFATLKTALMAISPSSFAFLIGSGFFCLTCNIAPTASTLKSLVMTKYTASVTPIDSNTLYDTPVTAHTMSANIRSAIAVFSLPVAIPYLKVMA